MSFTRPPSAGLHATGARATFAALLSLVAACDGGSPTRPEPVPEGAVFLIRACADSSSPGETFRVLIRDPNVVAEAAELVGAGPQRIVTSRLARGDGGFNFGWSWHLVPDEVRFVDFAQELCDACPGYVEENVAHWIDVVGRYCPWTTEVLARER